MTAADRLAEIQARVDNATCGPWAIWHSGTDYPQSVVANDDGLSLVAETFTSPKYPAADAEFIAYARTDVPRLVAALQAAIERHRPLRLYEHEDLCQDGTDDHIEERHRSWEYGEYFCLDLPTDYVYCAECRNDDGEQVDYPCPTVCAVEAALGGAS